MLNYLTRVYYATPARLRWIYWVLPIVYFLFPFDFLPDVLPLLGRVDDVLLALFVFWLLDRAKLFKDFFNEAKARQSASGSFRDSSPEAEEQDPYRVLGLDKRATLAEAKKAYRKLLRMHHPDKFAHMGPAYEATARRRTQVIIAAFQAIQRKAG